MKSIIVPLLLLFLAACSSSGNKETSANDSTAVADTVSTAVSLEGEGENDEESANDEASEDEEYIPNLDDEYAEWKNKVDDMKDTLHYVSISTSQYEAGSDVTWYFNSNMNPVYFTMSWSAEGNDGSTEYIMEEGRVVCSLVEEYNTQERWCQLSGGYRLEFDDNTGEADSTYLDDVYGDKQTASLKNYLNILSQVINEADEVDKDGDSYTLKIERVVNYGVEFTETTNVTIAKKVYEAYLEDRD